MIKLENTAYGVEISNIFEEGGWVIRPGENGNWCVFDIPQYGGPEQLIRSFSNCNLVDAIICAQKLT